MFGWVNKIFVFREAEGINKPPLHWAQPARAAANASSEALGGELTAEDQPPGAETDNAQES